MLMYDEMLELFEARKSTGAEGMGIHGNK